jgi:hypothetical protein
VQLLLSLQWELVKQQQKVFTNISATNKNRQDRAGAEWVIHLAPVFL